MNISRYINSVSALQAFQLMRFVTLIVIGILLVKFNYEKEEIGIYELFFFLANVLSFFWTMGLKNALISYYPTLEEGDQRKLIFNLFLILLVFGLLGATLLYSFQDYISYCLKKPDGIQYLPLIMGYLTLSAPANFIEYIYLLKGKNANIIKYGGAIFILQLSLLITGILLGFEIKLLLYLMLLWAGVKFLWLLIVLVANRSFEVDFKLIKIFLWFSLPLILHMLLGNGMEYVDGFIVNYFFDEGVFAQFRYGARELPLVTILAGALSTAMIPLAVNSMGEALSEVKIKVTRLMNGLFPISIILILLSPLVFPIIYSDEYEISARVFNVYLIIISSRLLMPQIILFAKQATGFLSLSAFIELIINVCLSLYLVVDYGIVGIAWATVIAYLINKVMLIFFVKSRFNINTAQYLNIKVYIIWMGILSLSYFVSTLYH